MARKFKDIKCKCGEDLKFDVTDNSYPLQIYVHCHKCDSYLDENGEDISKEVQLLKRC